MHSHIKKLKVKFVIMALCLTVVIGVGTTLIRMSDRLIIVRPFSSFVYRYAYAKQGGATGLEAAKTLFAATAEEAPNPAPATGIPVLLYHGIVKKADRFSLTEGTFADQMFALKRNGYRTITMTEFISFMEGKASLPDRSFLLTFDDGRVDSYRYADPILHALDFHAVMFVATDDSLPGYGEKVSTYYLQRGDLEDLLSSGRWDIGSHAVQATGGFVSVDDLGTKGDFLSNKMWIPAESRLETDDEFEQRIGHELGDAKQRLESTLGAAVTSFSYPFGDYGQQSVNEPEAELPVRAAVAAYYRAAFRQTWPNDAEFATNRPGDDMLRLKRIEVPTSWDGVRLVAQVGERADKRIPFSDAFDADSGWRGNWGSHAVAGGELALLAPASATGAGVFLDGSGSWHDYILAANIDWKNGSNVSLITGYVDSSHYLSCTFGKNSVKLERFGGGKPVALAERTFTVPLRHGLVELSMSSGGSSTSCIVGGKTMIDVATDGRLGGIGFKIWNETPGVAEVRVQDISVTAL